jgi:hypothetical protein
VEGIYTKRLQVVWENHVLHTCESPIEAIHRAQRLAANLKGYVFVYDFRAAAGQPEMLLVHPTGEIETLTWSRGKKAWVHDFTGSRI